MTAPDPDLPLLLIVEGENDIHFLNAMSKMLHRDHPHLPDIVQLISQRRVVFLPTGGSNFKEWLARVLALHKRAAFLVDREKEPETSARQKFVETVKLLPGCFAVMTRKRVLENYLHPSAILEACGIELRFDDDADVSGLLALKLMTRTGVTAWHKMSCKRQRRLHAKAKKILNIKAAQRMTQALLAEQDPHGEVAGWLQTIRRMMEKPSSPADY
jgi:hypothetical protein